VAVYVAIVLVAVFVGFIFLAFSWKSRRAARRDVEVQSQHMREKKTSLEEFDPKIRAGLRPLELSQVPRAYTPFSSLPPRWSPKFSPNPTAAPPLAFTVYSEVDEKAILPLYTASLTRALPPIQPICRSSQIPGLDHPLGGLERLDEEGRERVIMKLNRLLTKIKVEFREHL
jgi:hypothetical protein